MLTGEDGVFENAKPGTLVIDFSSIRPDVTDPLAEQAAEKGFRLLDAPVSGGEAGAVNAALSIMVGGSDDDFEAAKPYIDVVGKTVVHVGPNGAGQTVKAANQLIVAANIQALAEAVVFLEAYGVDTDAALEVLGGGLAGSKVLDQKKQNMLDRTFDPGFRIALHHKDLGIVTTAAREAGVVIPLGSLVAQLMASALANGDGGLDHSGLLRGVERLSGRTATMTKMRAVDAAVLILEKEGATQTFGLPGAAINPLYSAMRAHGGIKHVLARHVEGASHMAEGYTRAKAGNIGVCIGTSGPAGTDMITGLYSASADSIPILCITGQAPVAKLHKEDFQADQHRRHRQAPRQVGGHGDGAGAGARRVPEGVPGDARGPAGPGAPRPADGRTARRDRLRRRQLRADARQQAGGHPQASREGADHDGRLRAPADRRRRRCGQR